MCKIIFKLKQNDREKGDSMYLKNTSTNTMAMVNTKVGKLCVKPGEVICIKEKIFSPLARSLRKATEEEYLAFKNGVTTIQTEEDVNTSPSQVVEKRVEDTELKLKAIEAIKTELPQGGITEEDFNIAIEKVADEIKDEGTIDFIKDLFKFNMFGDKEITVQEEVVETPEEEVVVEEKDSLKLQKTTNEVQKELLEQQLNDLKETWQKTKYPRKKEKIYKEIQELQKQIAKL